MLVPLAWPSEPTETPKVVELTGPELGAAAAQQLMEDVNADAALLGSCDVLSLLQHVLAAAEAHLNEAAADN